MGKDIYSDEEIIAAVRLGRMDGYDHLETRVFGPGIQNVGPSRPNIAASVALSSQRHDMHCAEE